MEKYFIFSVNNKGRFWKKNRHGYTCFPIHNGLQVTKDEFLRMKAEYYAPERWAILTEEMALELGGDLDKVEQYDELAVNTAPEKQALSYFLMSYCLTMVDGWREMADAEFKSEDRRLDRKLEEKIKNLKPKQ